MIDDCACLSTIVEQTMFFGGSLSRIGLDFQSLLVVIFEDHLVSLMTKRWEDGLSEYQTSDIPTSVACDTNTTSTITNDPYNPPKLLMKYPTLAILTNVFLSSFNDLRRCAIVSCEIPLAHNLLNVLTKVQGEVFREIYF